MFIIVSLKFIFLSIKNLVIDFFFPSQLLMKDYSIFTITFNFYYPYLINNKF